MLHKTIERRWAGATVIVAATGPSLTEAVADECFRLASRHDWRSIAVSDAWRRLWWADVLYSCDAAWWKLHAADLARGGYSGERWSSHDRGTNNKLAAAEQHGLELVAGDHGDTFGTEQKISYGGNSGFQAINLALLFGAARVLLVGFDLRGSHFFGKHPEPLKNGDPARFIPAFKAAAKRLPDGFEVINCTEGSALTCFPMMRLADAGVTEANH